MASVWTKLSEDQKLEILRRKYVKHESIGVLATELSMNAITLNRRLQELRAEMDSDHRDWKGENLQVEKKMELPTEKPLPDEHGLFDLLRKGPISIAELSNKLDRSEGTILKLLKQMEEQGYMIERTDRQVQVNTRRLPKIDYQPAKTLADQQGHLVTFGVISDTHFGSAYAQVSALRSFVQKAYDEGVRHIFHAGDVTAGIFGYKGQEFDLVPSCRPASRSTPWVATENQIWVADSALPQHDDLEYYLMGGNHDYWHVVNSGIDAVARLCRQRDDAIFLGYDVADIPVTDRVQLRLWHPSGGVPYSLSYRIQKGLEQLAFDELTRAVEMNDNSKVRILIAGHMHVEVKMHRGPMVAAIAGCFEGQTDYLKKKGLYPSIGGSIWRIRVTDSGMIQEVDYKFVPFCEIEDDWKNFPEPPDSQVVEEPDDVEVLFRLK